MNAFREIISQAKGRNVTEKCRDFARRWNLTERRVRETYYGQRVLHNWQLQVFMLYRSEKEMMQSLNRKIERMEEGKEE